MSEELLHRILKLFYIFVRNSQELFNLKQNELKMYQMKLDDYKDKINQVYWLFYTFDQLSIQFFILS